MAFISTIAQDQATAGVAALYEENLKVKGYLPNYVRLFSHRPQVYAAWSLLLRSIKTDPVPVLDDSPFRLGPPVQSEDGIGVSGVPDLFVDKLLAYYPGHFSRSCFSPSNIMRQFRSECSRSACVALVQGLGTMRTIPHQSGSPGPPG